MYKNRLQEVAQRSCFNLPSYVCIREGPDHAPRFKASVNFNGELFESPGYCSTIRQAEHAAAEVAFSLLSTRCSTPLTARVLDETGVYKNLLQETAHKAGLNLPVYTTERSRPGHARVFTCTVDIAGLCFTGEPAKTKKQAEKNAAIAAWSALKKMSSFSSPPSKEGGGGGGGENDEEVQEHVIVERVLSSFRPKTEKPSRRNGDNQSRAAAAAARKRVFKRHTIKDTNNKPSAPTNSLMKPPKHMPNPATNISSSEYGGSQGKQNSFADQLPPPPPRTTSQILPSPKERPSSPYSLSDNLTPLQKMASPPHTITSMPETRKNYRGEREKEKEEEGQDDKSDSAENLAGKEEYTTTITNPDTKCSPSPLPGVIQNQGIQGTQLKSISMRSYVPRPGVTPLATKESSFTRWSHIGRMAICPQNGGFSSRGSAVPAVHVRTVIPVCAAPPPPTSTRPTSLLPSLRPEDAPSSSSTGCSSSLAATNQNEAGDASSSGFDPSKTDLPSSKMRYEFNRLQLGGTELNR